MGGILLLNWSFGGFNLFLALDMRVFRLLVGRSVSFLLTSKIFGRSVP